MEDDAADDDLDSLAGSLGSLHPPDAGAEADELDLKALGALSGRASQALHEPEDGVLHLSGAAAASAAKPASLPAPAVPRASSPPPVASVPAQAAVEPLTIPRRGAWVVPLVVGLGLGVGAAGLAFGLSARRQGDDAAAAAAAAAPPVTAAASPAPPAAAAPAPVAPPVAEPPAPSAALAAVVDAPPAAPAVDAPRPAAAPAAARGARTASNAPAAADDAPVRIGTPAPAAPDAPVLALRPSAEPATVAPTAAPAQTGAKRGTSVDELLDQALAPPDRAAALRQQQTAQLEQDALPETPSREAVTKAMTTMLPAISGCAMGHSGLATATIVVRGDGRVANAEIAGAPFAGGPSGRCMEGVIRRTAFPRFRQQVFRIKYPLSIQ